MITNFVIKFKDETKKKKNKTKSTEENKFFRVIKCVLIIFWLCLYGVDATPTHVLFISMTLASAICSLCYKP
jgi:capsule polysaccharide export protein KpsE/RkpR